MYFFGPFEGATVEMAPHHLLYVGTKAFAKKLVHRLSEVFCCLCSFLVVIFANNGVPCREVLVD